METNFCIPRGYHLVVLLLFKPQITAKIVDNDHTNNWMVKFKNLTLLFVIVFGLQVQIAYLN